MKHIFLIAGIILSCMAFKAGFQGNPVVAALKQGNSVEFSSFFDNAIDLKLPSKEETKNITKDQATAAVKGFFEQNKIKGFETLSQREMGGTMYVTGKLVDDAKGFNITVMMKDKGGKPNVITVRIN